MDIAERLAPLVRMDSREPFPFTDVAVSVLTPGDRSPSSGHVLDGPGDVVVEYALWVDVEIGHAYELEHVWVFADRLGVPVAVHGSAHGSKRVLSVPGPGERPVVFSEPGKHGMAASPDGYAISRELVNTLCGAAAGTMGVHCPVDGNDLGCSVADYRRAWNMLRARRFSPAWDAAVTVDVRDLRWWSWPEFAGQREPRGLAAIADASAGPAAVPVGGWGGPDDAWIERVTCGPAGLVLGGMPLADAFAEAQRHARLVVAVTETAGMVAAVAAAAWECYASAHTFIVCPVPATATRPATLAVPAGYVSGTAQLVVSDTPRDDFLTLGPGGDLDCPRDLLGRCGWSAGPQRQRLK